MLCGGILRYKNVYLRISGDKNIFYIFFIIQLHTHSTLDTLAKFIPIDALPNEAGGKAGPLKELHEKEVKLLEEYREWFLEEERTKRVNESLRPGKGKSATDLFGVEGSFKKLEID